MSRRLLRRIFCLLLLGGFLVTTVSVPAAPTYAAPPAKKTPKKRLGVGDFQGEITEASRQAVREGLDYLARGIENSPNGGAPSRSYPVAVTALSGLAFLANGETPTRGPHAVALRKCVEYILGRLNPQTGVISEPTRSGLMYSHGFATLFLAEVYGTTRSRKIRTAVRKAVRLIENAQNGQGGWNYAPSPRPDTSDMSIGVCQTMALRAARNAGVAVSEKVKDRAIQCAVRARSVANVTKGSTLGFVYRSKSPGRGGPRWPITNGTLCVLFGLGVYKDNGMPKPEDNPGMLILPALRFVEGQLGALNNERLPGSSWPFYANYYLAQALAHAGGKDYWGRWYPKLSKAVVRRRSGTHWSGGSGSYYATAMSCLILTVPYQYLPTFEH